MKAGTADTGRRQAAALLDDALRAEIVCHLTTIGRRTGRPREIEIWFAADGDTVYLLSGGRDDAHWVRNLLAEPKVSVRIGTREFDGRASVVEGGPADPVARGLMARKYGTSGLKRWLRESLPVQIVLDRER